jgi:MoxR-like ATPase
VTFVVSDPAAVEVLQGQVERRAYDALRNVLFFEGRGNDFRLERWLHWGSGPTAQEQAVFPGTTPVQLAPVTAPAPPSGPGDAHPQEAQSELDWGHAAAVSDDPSGLVGALRPFRQAVAALEARKNVVLMGPPGTGKTELAVAICKILGVPHEVVTATSDWTTFDTIGGYLPDPSEQHGGTEPLNFVGGCVTRALERKRWVVIDELNRADIDKAFGELFTLLSDQNVRLPFKRRRAGGGVGDVVLGEAEDDEDEAIAVPEDWRIIGTMNTFDKASLYQLSFAFMRRFAFVEVDVPPRDKYEELLGREAAPLAAARGDHFRDQCLEMMSALFCPAPEAPPPTLRSLQLVVGPAIPLDVIRYVEARAKADADVGARSALREAVEMYLVPQFEGQDKKHRKIAKAIAKALSLPADEEREVERRLRTWTGYEPRKAT